MMGVNTCSHDQKQSHCLPCPIHALPSRNHPPPFIPFTLLNRFPQQLSLSLYKMINNTFCLLIFWITSTVLGMMPAPNDPHRPNRGHPPQNKAAPQPKPKLEPVLLEHEVPQEMLYYGRSENIAALWLTRLSIHEDADGQKTIAGQPFDRLSVEITSSGALSVNEILAIRNSLKALTETKRTAQVAVKMEAKAEATAMEIEQPLQSQLKKEQEQQLLNQRQGQLNQEQEQQQLNEEQEQSSLNGGEAQQQQQMPERPQQQVQEQPLLDQKHGQHNQRQAQPFQQDPLQHQINAMIEENARLIHTAIIRNAQIKLEMIDGPANHMAKLSIAVPCPSFQSEKPVQDVLINFFHTSLVGLLDALLWQLPNMDIDNLILEKTCPVFDKERRAIEGKSNIFTFPLVEERVVSVLTARRNTQCNRILSLHLIIAPEDTSFLCSLSPIFSPSNCPTLSIHADQNHMPIAIVVSRILCSLPSTKHLALDSEYVFAHCPLLTVIYRHLYTNPAAELLQLESLEIGEPNAEPRVELVSIMHCLMVCETIQRKKGTPCPGMSSVKKLILPRFQPWADYGVLRRLFPRLSEVHLKWNALETQTREESIDWRLSQVELPFLRWCQSQEIPSEQGAVSQASNGQGSPTASAAIAYSSAASAVAASTVAVAASSSSSSASSASSVASSSAASSSASAAVSSKQGIKLGLTIDYNFYNTLSDAHQNKYIMYKGCEYIKTYEEDFLRYTPSVPHWSALLGRELRIAECADLELNRLIQLSNCFFRNLSTLTLNFSSFDVILNEAFAHFLLSVLRRCESLVELKVVLNPIRYGQNLGVLKQSVRNGNVTHAVKLADECAIFWRIIDDALINGTTDSSLSGRSIQLVYYTRYHLHADLYLPVLSPCQLAKKQLINALDVYKKYNLIRQWRLEKTMELFLASRKQSVTSRPSVPAIKNIDFPAANL